MLFQYKPLGFTFQIYYLLLHFNKNNEEILEN